MVFEIIPGLLLSAQDEPALGATHALRVWDAASDKAGTCNFNGVELDVYLPEDEKRRSSDAATVDTIQKSVFFIRDVLSANISGCPDLPEEPPPAEDSEDEACQDKSRIRVRLRRSDPDEKWGMKWHANIFKKQHQLVVEDVVEGSILDYWNCLQPEGRRIDYG